MATMNRKPAQDDIEEADSALGNTDGLDLSADSIDLEGTYAPEASVKEIPVNRAPASSGFAPDEKAAMARGLTGAAPALLGFLFGSSPKIQSQNIQQGQEYYANGTPKKLVMTAGDDGSPVYTDSRDAVGQKAYQKPMRGAAPGAGISPITYKDPQTGLEAIGFADKANMVVKDTNGNIVQDPLKFQGPKVQEVTDEKGNKKFVTISPTGEVSNNSQIASGLGQKYGLRQDEVEQGDKYAEKYLQDVKPIYDSKVSLKGAMRLLNAPDQDAVTQAAGVFRTAKAIVNERISDQERGFVTAPPGYFDKIQQEIEKIATNQNPQEQLRQLRAVLVELDKGNDDALASVQDRMVRAYSAGDQRKAKYLSDKIVQGSDVNTSPRPVVTQTSPSAPVKIQAPAPNVTGKNSPKFTPEQWNALTPAQKQREIERNKNARAGK